MCAAVAHTITGRGMLTPQGLLTPEEAQEREVRLNNSTSSIFASSTLSNPDADQIILCMSAVLKIQMDHDCEASAEERLPFAVLEVPGEGTHHHVLPSVCCHVCRGVNVVTFDA